jgi:hypothetical protein
MRPAFVSWAVLGGVLAGGGASAQPLRFDRERVMAFDMRVERFSPRRSPATGGAGVAWVAHLPPLVRGVPSIRLHFRVLTAGDPASWELRVKDLAGGTLQVIPGSDATPGGASAFWTDELAAPQARVELSWSGQGARPVLEADRYAYAVGAATPLSTVGIDGTRPIGQASERHRALAPPVARLRIMTDEGQGFCTGFLLGERLLMTNEHCVRSAEEAASLLADFRYDAPAARPEVVRGATLLRTSADLDYTLLRLATPVATGLGRLHLETVTPARDRQELLIIQHPGGEPKQVSLEGCLVAGLQREGASMEKTDFGHECDTLGGSSGSPVLDRATGRVVGLHHFGFREGLDEPVNQAVDIASILEDLSTQVDPAVFDEVRQAPPP